MIHNLKSLSNLIKISCTQEAFNVPFNKNRAGLRRRTTVVTAAVQTILFHTSRFPSSTTTISTSLLFAPHFSDLVTAFLSSIQTQRDKKRWKITEDW